MWFDSHCHLHLCGDPEPVDAVVARARQAGVVQMLTVGIDIESSRQARELARIEGVYAAIGVHPNSADGWDRAAMNEIESLSAAPGVVAIGESGLDYYRDRVTPNVQRAAFADHIALAKELDKTLVIHTRASVGDAISLLEEVGPPTRTIFHCWSGDSDELDRAVGLAAYVSFAGNVSFKNAPELREAAARVPADRLLVETDSPFLAPVPHRGKPNEPRHLPFVGAAIAEARSERTRAIADLSMANARAAFAL